MCEWIIECASAPVQLSFTAFDLEANWDFVHFFDSDSPVNDQLIRSLSGSAVPTGVVSTGSHMYLQFTSDGSLSGNGFTAVVHCPAGSLVAECEGCAAGRYDHDMAADTLCEDCPAGQAVADTRATECTTCGFGSYAIGGSTECRLCAPGQYDHDASSGEASWRYQWSVADYNWTDVTAIDSPISPSEWAHGVNSWPANDGYVARNIPFGFACYGVSHSTLHINTNGYIVVGPANYDSDSLGRSVPLPARGVVGLNSYQGSNGDSLFIAIMWADLDPSSGGDVYYTASTGAVIVSYVNVPYCCGAAEPSSNCCSKSIP
eukprot:COSAG02_NODE_12821_length_1487_cov_1.652017_1_plen_317_part_10